MYFIVHFPHLPCDLNNGTLSLKDGLWVKLLREQLIYQAEGLGIMSSGL